MVRPRVLGPSPIPGDKHVGHAHLRAKPGFCRWRLMGTNRRWQPPTRTEHLRGTRGRVLRIGWARESRRPVNCLSGIWRPLESFEIRARGRGRGVMRRKTQPKQAPSLMLEDVPDPTATRGTSATVQFGIWRPPQQQLLLYAPGEWEEFVREWVHSLKQTYSKVLRVGGAGDLGIDVAGFTDAKLLCGVWDNYQCKHFAQALTPSDASPEIAKVLWYSFQKRYMAPRKYFFVAPKECGISLKKLLLKPDELRAYVVEHWDTQCANSVTQDQTIALDGAFLKHVDGFDFSIFDQRTLFEVIEAHRTTPYHAVRFGGGLPSRPPVTAPAFQEREQGSRYIQQIFEAYSDHTKTDVVDLACLSGRQELTEHFHSQREFFYHAEALRNFARDTVPAGTFEELQSEVHAGVRDVEGAPHADGYVRMNSVTQAAVNLHLTSNALLSVTKVQDRKGMCHQLANDNRLRWRKP